MLSGIKKCLSTHYAHFGGRSTRREWTAFLIFYLICLLVEYLLFHYFGKNLGFFSQPLSTRDMVIIGVIVLLNILLLIPFVAVSSRRCHDFAVHGAWAFLPPVLAIFSLVGSWVLRLGVGELPQWELWTVGAVSILAFISLLGLLIYGMLRKGTVGPNRFGADPLATAAAE